LTIPSSLAGSVDGVIGLDQSYELVHPDSVSDAPPSAAFLNAPPCSTYWDQTLSSGLPQMFADQPWAPCGYTPPQLRGAYEGGSNLTGARQTVAIIDAYASPTIFQDAQTYSQNHDPGNVLTQNQFQQVVAPGTFRRPENNKQDPQGWYGEETLDVEAVHAMAPGADIVFVGAPNNYQDLDAALNHVVDRHLADVVTNSYGFIGEAVPPGFIIPYNQTLLQGALEGISILFSSGDSGDETINGIPPSPDWSASDPWVTAVGGTSLEVGSSDNYLAEFGWSTFKYSYDSSNDAWNPLGFVYGSGGGVSNIFAEPSYQSGAGIDSSSFGFGRSGRVVPDVSMVGDPNTGMLVGQTQTFPDGSVAYSEYRIGGTSLASPLFAGILAVVNQSRMNAGDPSIGFANPALYGAPASAYNDIADPMSPTTGVARNDFANSVDSSDGVVTSLRALGWEGQTIHATIGYDDMTGLGTPNGTAFINALTP
jgi:subtilase family serine protease